MRASFLTILLLMAGPFSVMGQGKLDRIREAVSDKEDDSDQPEKKSSSRRNPDHCHDDDDNAVDAGMGKLFLYAVCSPFFIPHCAAGDTFERWGYFPAFPYADHDGYMHINPGQREEGHRYRNWAGRFSIENGNDFAGLNRTNVTLFLETSCRIGLQSRWNLLTEDLGRQSDEAILGSTELTFRFAQSKHFQMFAGLGFNTLLDDGQNRWGFNFTYGADIFPVQPFVISLVTDLGTLGSATVTHIRGTFGMLFERYEVFAGFDYRNISGVPIYGPLAGVRLWY